MIGYVCVIMCKCACVSVCVYVCVCVSLCVSVCGRVGGCGCLCVCVCVRVHVSVSVSESLCVCGLVESPFWRAGRGQLGFGASRTLTQDFGFMVEERHCGMTTTGGRLVPTTTGSPILQPEALYCNWAWIWAKPETTISQPAKKLTFCNTLHGFQSDSQPLRKDIQF